NTLPFFYFNAAVLYFPDTDFGTLQVLYDTDIRIEASVNLTDVFYHLQVLCVLTMRKIQTEGVYALLHERQQAFKGIAGRANSGQYFGLIEEYLHKSE